MKIVVKEKAFFNGEIIKPGTIIDIQNMDCPKWGEIIPTPANNVQQNLFTDKTNEELEENNQDEEEQVQVNKDDEFSDKTEEELEKILYDLTTEAIGENIFIEDVENKTVIEQIKELQNKLKKE